MATKNPKTKQAKASEHTQRTAFSGVPEFPAKLVQVLADEVAKSVINRMPVITHRPPRQRKKNQLENAVFLDTSAIIDGRVFDVVNMGVLTGTLVIPESILLELKHIADSQDMVKRERG